MPSSFSLDNINRRRLARLRRDKTNKIRYVKHVPNNSVRPIPSKVPVFDKEGNIWLMLLLLDAVDAPLVALDCCCCCNNNFLWVSSSIPTGLAYNNGLLLLLWLLLAPLLLLTWENAETDVVPEDWPCNNSCWLNTSWRFVSNKCTAVWVRFNGLCNKLKLLSRAFVRYVLPNGGEKKRACCQRQGSD